MRSQSQLKRDVAMNLSRRFNRSLSPPDRVSVNVTLRCNLSCTMCTTCYDSPELSLTEIKNIIDQTADWGVEVFNPLGGEPFMRGDIEEVLSYAVSRGFYVTVTTNGTLITESRAAAIAAIPADRLHFNISLDGDAAANDEIRSQGMWDRAIAGFLRIRSADKAAGNARRKILANTILHARNVHRFEAIMAEQEALGFDGIQVLNLFRAGPDVPESVEGLWFGEESHEVLGTLSATLARRAEAQAVVGYRIQNSPDSLRRIPQYYREALTPLDAPCWAGWKELYINADGQAIMCDGALDFLNGSFGNIREESLKSLWSSPALTQRRAVVKQCTSPCIQDCYLRGQSDALTPLVAEASKRLAAVVAGRVARFLPAPTTTQDGTLCLELSDVCPCSLRGCTTPVKRWEWLTRSVSEGFDEQRWAAYRDAGQVDFGRGFIGLDVVRRVVDDLRRQRLLFDTLAVRWRGEPLLHPQAEAILDMLLKAIASGAVANRLCIETDARFLSDDVVALTRRDGAQTWVLDLDRGGLSGVKSAFKRLAFRRHSNVQLLVTSTASAGVDIAALRSFGLPIVLGDAPGSGDAVWVRRGSAGHYQADQAATAALSNIAAKLGQQLGLVQDRAPTMEGLVHRAPTISWDGKVTMDTHDVRLESPVGDVIHARFSDAWAVQQ